jgi:hypothetical protein
MNNFQICNFFLYLFFILFSVCSMLNIFTRTHTYTQTQHGFFSTKFMLFHWIFAQKFSTIQFISTGFSKFPKFYAIFQTGKTVSCLHIHCFFQLLFFSSNREFFFFTTTRDSDLQSYASHQTSNWTNSEFVSLFVLSFFGRGESVALSVRIGGRIYAESSSSVRNFYVYWRVFEAKTCFLSSKFSFFWRDLLQ